MRSEAALCLAFDKVSEARGVTTPAACLGMPLVERLRRAGMTFEVDLGAPPLLPGLIDAQAARSSFRAVSR